MNYKRPFSIIAIAAMCIALFSTCKNDKDDAPVSYDWEPKMVLVEGGTFTMGCTDGEECLAEELPLHQVTLSSFQIAQCPVTQKLWKEVMESNPSYFGDCDDCPVETVSWDNVQEFITKLNKLTGKNYRLPTEAEWEYAARGGNQSKGYKYSGSDNIDVVGWCWENSEGKTHPVGTKTPNELGIYDMSGNVWEWCHDWYATYTEDAQTNPQGPAEGSYRVLRGGSWADSEQSCCVSCRGNLTPASRSYFYGFRLVLVP